MNRSLSRQAITVITSALLILSPLTLQAAPHYKKHSSHKHTDYAKVTHVEPIYKTISHRVPKRSCWIETVYEPVNRRSGSHTPTLLGTIIGGAIGNEVGHSKTNKKVGTVVGAALGASIARDIKYKNSGQVVARDKEVCDTHHRVEYEEKLTGYNVSYRYQGRTYHTNMRQHPGDRIRVAVQVQPVY